MKNIVALPLIVLAFGLSACATTTKEAAPAPAASAPASAPAATSEPELLGAPKKEQGS